MSLQNAMHRRKFMERSIMGAGGLLLSSALLESCITDHVTPNPNDNQGIPSLLLDEAIDWNHDAKILVKTGVEMIPEAGEILGLFVEIFWPEDKEDVWSQVKSQVEKVINDTLDVDTYNTVKGYLNGYKDVINLYVSAINKNGDAATHWLFLRDSFAKDKYDFQKTNYEVLLLPLFAQFVNMYLNLLRDAVTHGESIGLKPGDIEQSASDLTTLIPEFTAYVNGWTINGSNALNAKTKPDNSQCEPFRTLNNYDRQLKLTVLDYRDTWPYYDTSKYPDGTQFVSYREIYSDPMGSCTDSGNIVLPYPPTQLPIKVTIWGGVRIDAAQLTYPANGGPAGVTQTARMGNQPNTAKGYGGVSSPPAGGSFDLSPANPITQVQTVTGRWIVDEGQPAFILSALQFQFNDGTKTNFMGSDKGMQGPANYLWVGYPYEAMSSIHINGVSKYGHTSDCIVIGFQAWTPPSAQLKMLQQIFVKSPKERSVADFAKAYPKLGITEALINDELRAARKAYWEKR